MNPKLTDIERPPWKMCWDAYMAKNQIHRRNSIADYNRLLDSIEETWHNVLRRYHNHPVFETLPHYGTYDRFLTRLPKDVQKFYDCSVCRKFVDRYGGLAVVDPDTGSFEQIPLLWNPDAVPELFREGVCTIYNAIKASPIEDVWSNWDDIIGTRFTGEHHQYKHMAIRDAWSPRHFIPGDVRANVKNLAFALDAFDPMNLDLLTILLRNARDIMEWFVSVVNIYRMATSKRQKIAITWVKAIEYPEYCRIGDDVCRAWLEIERNRKRLRRDDT